MADVCSKLGRFRESQEVKLSTDLKTPYMPRPCSPALSCVSIDTYCTMHKHTLPVTLSNGTKIDSKYLSGAHSIGNKSLEASMNLTHASKILSLTTCTYKLDYNIVKGIPPRMIYLVQSNEILLHRGLFYRCVWEHRKLF